MANKISLEKCKYYFDWNENGELYWKVNVGSKIRKNHRAGSNSNGYFVVNVEYKRYQVHRILYQLYHNIELENELIDHIDGNPSNNSKENLRICTHAENMRNRKTHKNNKTTGLKNIYIIKDEYINYFHIRIKKDRKYVFSKCFRTDEYTLEDVIKIRDEQLKEFHKDFSKIYSQSFSSNIKKNIKKSFKSFYISFFSSFVINCITKLFHHTFRNIIFNRFFNFFSIKPLQKILS